MSCYCCFVLLDLRSGLMESDVVSLYVLRCSVNGSVCFMCRVFVNCLVKQFAICLGVLVILLLNVMELLSVGGAVSSKEWVCCACVPSECLDAPSICCVFVCRKLSPHLEV